jgi:serine/threonine protein kinase
MLQVLGPGTMLDGRYEILAPLAEGGMGAVYRARRCLLGDDVAIKIVRSDMARDPAAHERFLREARACAQLRHPNIVSILDFNLDAQGRPFLVMELLNGRSLRQQLGQTSAMPLVDVLAIVIPLTGALQCAHAQGVFHRDIKPANIVSHEFGGGAQVYKIVDFGLAREKESGDTTRLTAVDQFVGTVVYAAPEQIFGHSIDGRSDVYSLAVVTFEMLTGRLPVDVSDPAQLAVAMARPAPRPSAIRADLPSWVDIVLGRALARDPADRYESAAAFGEALETGGRSRDTVILNKTVSDVRGPAHTSSTPGYKSSGLLGTYELGARIGAGRLGSEVFHGTHRTLRHPVAIRVLRRTHDRDWDGVRARFLREAQTLQVQHPSMIQVRDFGEEGDLVYLVTDFIDGPNLRQLLQTEGPLPWPRARPLIVQLLDAARALHKHGGLLCGASPDIIRIAVDEDGPRVMLSTAGLWDAKDLLATLGDATLHGGALADVELHYVAPEILTGEHADVRSDVFTLGVLAYEMTTGLHPYEGASMPALLGAMLRGQARNPREVQPTLPEHVAGALLKSLSPDAAARQASARDLAQQMFDSKR